MRIALLSNITIDLLAGSLKKTNEVYIAPGYDTWQQEIMNPGSGLYQFKPEAVVVLIYADAYPDIWNSRENGDQAIDEWNNSISMLGANLPGVPVFVSSLDISLHCHYGAELRLDKYFEDSFIEQIEKDHTEGKSVYVLPVAEAASDMGREKFYSSKMWYVGSMPYSLKGLSVLSDLITRYAGVTKGAKKKCLAVDLDNTLWGGVIGEDGIDGIVLSNNKEGARYKDAQRALKKMKEQGVMLAIISKNNPEDVEPVFKHPDMVLQHEDFVAEVINWKAKPENIRNLAKNLNIGLDAFVFLDDNPAEREQMKAECSEVAVADFPKDTSLLPETVEKIYDDYFFTLEVTGEDLKKTDMYRAQSQRNAEMSAASSVGDFLKKLDMTIGIHFMKEEEKPRVTQLINKTNQFNVTTKRYSAEEINAIEENRDDRIFTVHVADKYGDQGLVAVLILKKENASAYIDTFLMSCRVMGREVEKEIMAAVKDFLRRNGIQTIKAEYVKTAKNAPVKELFEKLGFKATASSEDKKEYEADVADLPEKTGFFKGEPAL